jgi:RNA polymerase sigma factor (sigma-70 family)
MEDRRLLRRFVEENSQEAFAALTTRYLGLVYSVCRRELADAEAAEDVTQAVFLILARKAPTLRRGVVLSGWLFQTARFAAKNARLQAQRRADYEQKAAEAMQQQSEGREDAAWTEIEPLLNRSLAALKEGERDCVLLRYFQEMSFAEAGAALGLSEEAARKRVARSLEKIRKFFEKGGVIVPGAALAILLSARAAKAVPAACQTGIATITTGVRAGHFPLSLTGSHVHQLSEGVLKAMKIVQLKIAASIAATVVIGLTTYTIAKGITPVVKTSHKIAPMLAGPKPGHVLAQAPGKALTAAQIIDRCREAYGALQSYQGTTMGTTQGVTGLPVGPSEYHTSADIQFVRPGQIRAEGLDMSGHSFAYVADGAAAYDKNLVTKDVWQKAQSTEMVIARVTGIAQSSATTIPALLLGIASVNPLAPAKTFAPEVGEEDVDGHHCYLVTSSLVAAAVTTSRSFWVDEKTFLLRRSLIDISGTALGTSVQSHIDQRFKNERLNEAVPDSAFTLPPSQ